MSHVNLPLMLHQEKDTDFMVATYSTCAVAIWYSTSDIRDLLSRPILTCLPVQFEAERLCVCLYSYTDQFVERLRAMVPVDVVAVCAV